MGQTGPGPPVKGCGYLRDTGGMARQPKSLIQFRYTGLQSADCTLLLATCNDVNATTVGRREPARVKHRACVNSITPPPPILTITKTTARGSEPDMVCMMMDQLAGSYEDCAVYHVSPSAPPAIGGGVSSRAVAYTPWASQANAGEVPKVIVGPSCESPTHGESMGD